MNDGMYTNLRNYLEEIASQNKQLLEAVHEIRLAANRIDGRMKGVAKEDEAPAKTAVPKAAASVEKQLEAETGKDFTKTGDNPPTFAETDRPVVPRRQDAPVEGLAALGTMTAPKQGQVELPSSTRKGK